MAQIVTAPSPRFNQARQNIKRKEAQYLEWVSHFSARGQLSLSNPMEYSNSTGSERSASLVFQYNPASIKISRAPSYASNTPPGWSHALQQFGNSGSREWSFLLAFNGLGNHPSDPMLLKQDIQQELLWFEAATVPGTRTLGDRSIVTAPPMVDMWLGDNPTLGFMRGIIKSYKIDIFMCTPDYRPLAAEVDVTFEEQPTTNITVMHVLDTATAAEGAEEVFFGSDAIKAQGGSTGS